MATIGGRLLGLHKTVPELGLLSGGTLQVVERLRGWFSRLAKEVLVGPTRNTCYRCGCPRGADRVVSEGPSPGFTVGDLGRVAATRGSPVNPSYRVSPPGAGVGGFLGGKGNGAGSRNPQAAGGGVDVPSLGGLSPRAQSGDLPVPLPVGEVRSFRRVTFSDTGGPDEALKAVDLLGGFLVGLGVEIEALKSKLRSPPSTQQSDVAPTGRLLAQEYHQRTKKMEQLQKKLQTGRGRVSRATEELEGARDAVAAMEEEDGLLEGEVGDLRRRIAEEREGSTEEREGRVLEVMEGTETAVEVGVVNKKKGEEGWEGEGSGRQVHR